MTPTYPTHLPANPSDPPCECSECLKMAAHDLECSVAAYSALIERAEKEGNRQEAKQLRAEMRTRIGRIQFASAGSKRER